MIAMTGRGAVKETNTEILLREINEGKGDRIILMKIFVLNYLQ